MYEIKGIDIGAQWVRLRGLAFCSGGRWKESTHNITNI